MADVIYTAEEMDELEDMTDWERVRNMKDEDIIIDDESPDVAELIASGKGIIIHRGPLNGYSSNELKRKALERLGRDRL